MPVANGELTVAPAEPPAPEPEGHEDEAPAAVDEEIRRVLARERRRAERLVAT